MQAVQSMLLPQEGSLSIHTSLPATGDGSSPVMAAVRLLAEIRSRLVVLGLELHCGPVWLFPDWTNATFLLCFSERVW